AGDEIRVKVIGAFWPDWQNLLARVGFRSLLRGARVSCKIISEFRRIASLCQKSEKRFCPESRKRSKKEEYLERYWRFGEYPGASSWIIERPRKTLNALRCRTSSIFATGLRPVPGCI